MTPDFRGRRILLIAPRFFGYERTLAQTLEGLGATVRYVDARPGNGTLAKALLRLHPLAPLTRPLVRRHFRRALRALAGDRFDDILVISPEGLDEGVLAPLRRAQPGARLLLYMWDALANKGLRGARASRFIALFDHAYSFDDQDAAQYGMELRPLFCAWQAPAGGDGDPAFLFSFVGTIHSDRYRILRTLVRSVQGRTLKPFVYPFLPGRALYWLNWLTRPEFRQAGAEAFQYVPMPYGDVQAVFRASQCILDIEHPGQRGLTMRTLEVLSAGKHLITTNPHIRKYPFYRPDRVTVIDRQHPSLPDPLPQPAPLTLSERHALSLTGWCEDVFKDVPGGR